MNYCMKKIIYYQYIVHISEYLMRDEKLGQILCNRISHLQRQYNLTIEQLAYQSGISKGGLSEIMHGKKEPSNYTISNICAALGISMSEFFDFEELKQYIKNKI